MLSDAASARPDLKAYNDDGTPYLHQYESYGQIYYVENPIIETMENTTTDNSNNLRMTANLEFKILPELKLFTQYTHNMRKSESYKYASSRTYEGSDYWGGQQGKGEKTHRNTTNREFEARLTYNGAFKEDHRLTAVGAMTYTNDDNDYYTFSMVDFPDDDIQNAIWQGVNMSDSYNRLTGDATGSVMLSFVGRADYRFKDRYLLTASIRADGSSRFSPDNRWGIFPAVALGWVISDEKFLKKATWLPYLKLRAGWGKTGNGWVGEYGWRTMFTNSEYNGKPAVVPDQIGNDELKWESTVQWDLGLDYGFLKGQRLSGTLGFYLKKTDGLLYSYTMAPSTGMYSTRVNFANIENGRNRVTAGRNVVESPLRDMVFFCQIVDQLLHILTVVDISQFQQMTNLCNSERVYDYTPMIFCFPPNRFNQRTDKEKIVFPTVFTSGHRPTSLLSRRDYNPGRCQCNQYYQEGSQYAELYMCQIAPKTDKIAIFIEKVRFR